MNKQKLLHTSVTRLEAQAQTLIDSAEETRRGAIHEESRPENDKDTRGLEASYLARGKAARVEEIQEAIGRLRLLELPKRTPEAPVDLGALVQVEEDDAAKTRWFWVVPAAGGLKVTHEGHMVQLVTPQSPFGRAVLGQCAGDDFVVMNKQWTILRVC